MQRRRIIMALPVVVMLLIPFETPIVPAWRLKVIDEDGNPYINMKVRQAWKDYTLDPGAGEHIEDRWTDENGYVFFPERTIYSSLLSRLFLPVYSNAMRLAHGGFGIHADVAATGPQGYQSLQYDPNKPLPQELLLLRRKT